jgi:hypothetical protein
MEQIMTVTAIDKTGERLETPNMERCNRTPKVQIRSAIRCVDV